MVQGNGYDRERQGSGSFERVKRKGDPWFGGDSRSIITRECTSEEWHTGLYTGSKDGFL